MNLADEYHRRCEETSDINEHLPTLFDAVMAVPHTPVVLELGTRTGNSTAAFLHALQVRKCGLLTSVDLDMPQVPGEWYQLDQWQFHRADDTDWTMPGSLALRPGSIDVLFVDTSHTYEHTLAELVMYMPLVAPGGTALFHDTQIVSDVCHVARALDEYCADKDDIWHAGTQLTWTEDPKNNGLGMIVVPG
jgi:cephalosporin hydroxylase